MDEQARFEALLARLRSLFPRGGHHDLPAIARSAIRMTAEEAAQATSDDDNENGDAFDPALDWALESLLGANGSGEGAHSASYFDAQDSYVDTIQRKAKVMVIGPSGDVEGIGHTSAEALEQVQNAENVNKMRVMASLRAISERDFSVVEVDKKSLHGSDKDAWEQFVFAVATALGVAGGKEQDLSGARLFFEGEPPVEISDLAAIADGDSLLLDLFPLAEVISEVAVRRILDTVVAVERADAVRVLHQYDGDSDLALLTLLNGPPENLFARRGPAPVAALMRDHSTMNTDTEPRAQLRGAEGKEEADDSDEDTLYDHSEEQKPSSSASTAVQAPAEKEAPASTSRAPDLSMQGFFEREETVDDGAGSSSESSSDDDATLGDDWFIDPMVEFVKEQQASHRQFLLDQGFRWQPPGNSDAAQAHAEDIFAQHLQLLEDNDGARRISRASKPAPKAEPAVGRRHTYRQRLKERLDLEAASKSDVAAPKKHEAVFIGRELSMEERRARAKLIGKAKHKRSNTPASVVTTAAPSPLLQGFLSYMADKQLAASAKTLDQNTEDTDAKITTPAAATQFKAPVVRGRRLFEVRRDLLKEAQDSLPKFEADNSELPWERVARERREAKARPLQAAVKQAASAAALEFLGTGVDSNTISTGFWVVDYERAYLKDREASLLIAPNLRNDCANQQAAEVASLKSFLGNARFELGDTVPVRAVVSLRPLVDDKMQESVPPLPLRALLLLTMPPLYPIAGGPSLHVRLVIESTLPAHADDATQDSSQASHNARALFDLAVWHAAREFITDTVSTILSDHSATGTPASLDVVDAAELWLGTTLRECAWWRNLSTVLRLDEESRTQKEKSEGRDDALRFLIQGVDFRCLPQSALLQQQQSSILAVADSTGFPPAIARLVLRNAAKWDAPALLRRIHAAQAGPKRARRNGRRGKQTVAPVDENSTAPTFDEFLRILIDEAELPENVRSVVGMHPGLDVPQPVSRLLELLNQSDKETEEPLLECPVCMDYYELRDCVVISGCGHAHCSDCFVAYTTMKVNESGAADSGDTVRCPAPDCKEVIDSVTLRSLLDSKTLQRFQNYAASSYVSVARNLTWCPAPGGCPVKGVIALADKYNRIEKARAVMVGCDCGFVFCFACRREGHWPAQCHHIEWFEKAFGRTFDSGNEDEVRSAKWMEKFTQDCPKCRSPIEKMGGCNHMTCHNCRYEFCWICHSAWSGSHYQCTAVEASAATGDRSLLERFFNVTTLSWNQLFVLHERSRVHDDARIKNIAMRKLRSYLRTVRGATLEDCQRICVAVEHIFLCRHIILQTCKLGMFCHEFGVAKQAKKLKSTIQLLQGHVNFVSSLIDVPVTSLDIANIVAGTRAVRNGVRNFQESVNPILDLISEREVILQQRKQRKVAVVLP